MDRGGADDDSVPMQNKEAKATFNEPDATLKDIMNTILDEAMARGHGSTSKDAVPSAALSQAPTASPYVIVPFMSYTTPSMTYSVLQSTFHTEYAYILCI